MPKRKMSSNSSKDMAELLKDLLITQLGIAQVPQQSIRQIVGCDMNRVNRIVKHLKAPKVKQSV